MVLLGACGGIALYKVPLLISRLRELGAAVHVVMTEAATRFVTPLTFQTVSDNPVHTNLFGASQVWNVEQVALAERADLLVVAPATADIIGKAAAGVADDFLTTTLLAVTSPVLCVPAMNANNVWRAGGAGRTPRVLVGFAAETHDLLQSAGAKLKAKNADLIVANQVADAADSGFGAETNRVTILGRDGSVEELPLQSKSEVARAVFDRVTQLLREGGERDARPRGDDAARCG